MSTKGVFDSTNAPWTLADDAHLVKSVTQEAGRIALSYFQRPVESWTKPKGDLVSVADLAVDTFLRTTLLQNRTGYGWLSEETTDQPERLRCGRLWIVDPIDGTRAFLDGSDDWGVSVALVEHGEPVIAAFYAPARDSFFFASRGSGAFHNHKPITVKQVEDLAHAHMMGDPRAFADDRTWPVAWPTGMESERACSIALRLCMVADGEADCCVTLRPKNDWDVAAADLIVREAGGVVTTGHKQTLVFNREKPLFDHIVASHPDLIDDVMARVTPALEQWSTHGRKP